MPKFVNGDQVLDKKYHERFTYDESRDSFATNDDPERFEKVTN